MKKPAVAKIKAHSLEDHRKKLSLLLKIEKETISEYESEMTSVERLSQNPNIKEFHLELETSRQYAKILKRRIKELSKKIKGD